jgi:undecaprenyl-diphosphatase
MDWIASIESWDRYLVLFINGTNHPFLDQIMWLVSDPLFGVPFYLLFIYFIFKKHTSKETFLIVLMLAIIVGLADFTAHEIFKENFQRFRPSHHFDLKDHLHLHAHKDGSFYRGGKFGFISNHATNMSALCCGVFLVLKSHYKILWIYLLIFLVLISYSRIYLGVHYLTDIIVGWLVGFVLAFTGFIILKKIIYK